MLISACTQLQMLDNLTIQSMQVLKSLILRPEIIGMVI